MIENIMEPAYWLISRAIPLDCMQMGFMQRAMLGLLLLAPMAAAMGIQVVNFRMAFFADAISHSAFAGVALGMIFVINPHFTMPALALAVGLGIMAVQRGSSLSIDTVIGVFFSGVVAFGLAIVSRSRNVAGDLQRFLYGDILTIDDGELLFLAVLFALLMAFQFWGYNRLIYIGLNPVLAKAHRVKVKLFQYLYAGMLSLVVIFSVWAVGVLLVTAMLVVPAATARNMARSSGAMFWWALAVGVASSVAGLLISAQDWARTATGATVILCSCACFCASAAFSFLKRRA
jgi:zinc transport system permease protein